MCEINAYIFKDGNEVLFLGEQKEFEGIIRELSFRKNRVVLEKR